MTQDFNRENSLSPACGGEGQGEGDASSGCGPSSFGALLMSPSPQPSPPQSGGEGVLRAFVVFTGQADWPWLRWLKPGFRHCFVLLNDGMHWISVDPLLNHMEVQVHNTPAGFDLPGWLRSRGHRVVAAPVSRLRMRPAPFLPFTCVETAKRILGIHDLRVLTPWQLYRSLTKPSPLPHGERARVRGRAIGANILKSSPA